MRIRNVLVLTGMSLMVLGGCGDVEEIGRQIDTALGNDYDLPVTHEGPEMTVDVGREVARLEDKINERKDNSDDDRANYEILKALCETEPGRTCEPARFPTRIPAHIWPYGCIVSENGVPTYKEKEECTMDLTCEETPVSEISGTIDPMNLPTGNGCVRISTWLEQVEGLEDMTTIAQAVRYDVSDKIDLSGSSRVKAVTVNRVIFHFKENSLTYAIPTTTVLVGEVVSQEEANNAKQLIEDGDVVEFGTLSETAAMFTGEKAMSLNADGKAELSERLKGFAATLAAQASFTIPPPTEDARADNCLHPSHLTTNPTDYCESFPKPDGKVKFTVEMTVIFTINPKGE